MDDIPQLLEHRPVDLAAIVMIVLHRPVDEVSYLCETPDCKSALRFHQNRPEWRMAQGWSSLHRGTSQHLAIGGGSFAGLLHGPTNVYRNRPVDAPYSVVDHAEESYPPDWMTARRDPR